MSAKKKEDGGRGAYFSRAYAGIKDQNHTATSMHISVLALYVCHAGVCVSFNEFLTLDLLTSPHIELLSWWSMLCLRFQLLSLAYSNYPRRRTAATRLLRPCVFAWCNSGWWCKDERSVIFAVRGMGHRFGGVSLAPSQMSSVARTGRGGGKAP
jgi:hypothetical protein